MRTRTTLSLAVVGLVLAGLLAGCGDSSRPPTEAPAEPPKEAAADAPPEQFPPLAEEEQYTALLAVGLDYSYGLAPDDGAIEVLESMEGYGAVRWTTDEHSVIVTHRDADGKWDWVYVDENVDTDSVTPDALTKAERDDFLALAKAISTAVGRDEPVTEDYTYKATGGVKQGDYTAGGAPAGSMNLHFATDGEGRIGRIDFRVEN